MILKIKKPMTKPVITPAQTGAAKGMSWGPGNLNRKLMESLRVGVFIVMGFHRALASVLGESVEPGVSGLRIARVEIANKKIAPDTSKIPLSGW